MPVPSRCLARLSAAAVLLQSCSIAGNAVEDEPLPTVPWQPGPERFSVNIGEGSTISLYPESGEVGVSTGETLRQRLKDPQDGGQNWYFVELYDHMCPHCWYAVPIVKDVAGAYQDVDQWRMTSLNCHMRQNAEVCYFLEVISGAMDYPTFLLCPTPEQVGDFSVKSLPERAQKLMEQLDGQQRDTFMELVRCNVRYVQSDHTMEKGPFLSAESLAHWLQQQTSKKASHPELLTRGADFVDKREVGPRSAPGQPGWLKDDKPGEPGVPAFEPGQRWFDALRGFVNTLYQGYRSHRHDAAVAAATFLSLAFPIKGKELGKLAHELQKKGPQEKVEKFQRLLVDWASDNGLPDPSDEETAENYDTCDGSSNCAFWTLQHVTLTAIASRGFSGTALLGDESLSGKDPKDLVQPEQAVQFVRDYVEAFLSCGPCKQQFLEDFDSCELGNCQIENFRQLPLWLWRVHNSVSLRVAIQHKSKVDRRWPMFLDCPQCWRDEFVEQGDDARRLDSQYGAGEEVRFSAEDLDAPFDTSRVFWHMVRTYVSIQRVAFELNDLSAEEKEEISQVMEVERDMAAGLPVGKASHRHKAPAQTRFGDHLKAHAGASPALLMLFMMAGLIICVLCGASCVLGQVRDSSRAPIFREPLPVDKEGEQDADAGDMDPEGPAAE